MMTKFLFAEVALKKMIQGDDWIGPNNLRRIHSKIGLKVNRGDLVKSKRDAFDPVSKEVKDGSNHNILKQLL